MQKPTKAEIKIVDKILYELHNCGNSDLNIPYSILSKRVIEINDINKKIKIDNILSSNTLVCFKGNNDVYELTTKGRGITSFSEYLKSIRNKTIRNIILLGLGILIPSLALFFQIYDSNSSHSNQDNKNADSTHKESMQMPILNKIEKIDTSNSLQIHNQTHIQNTSKTIKSDSLPKK